MLSRLYGLFKTEAKNVLPITRDDVAQDFVYVDEKHELEEIYVLINLEQEEFENQSVDGKEKNESLITIANQSPSPIVVSAKTARQLRWEQQYHKIFAKVLDESGQALEIRLVNKGKQLAFWDTHINGQKNVHRSSKDDEIIMPNRRVLKIMK